MVDVADTRPESDHRCACSLTKKHGNAICLEMFELSSELSWGYVGQEPSFKLRKARSEICDSIYFDLSSSTTPERSRYTLQHRSWALIIYYISSQEHAAGSHVVELWGLQSQGPPNRAIGAEAWVRTAYEQVLGRWMQATERCDQGNKVEIWMQVRFCTALRSY